MECEGERVNESESTIIIKDKGKCIRWFSLGCFFLVFFSLLWTLLFFHMWSCEMNTAMGFPPLSLFSIHVCLFWVVCGVSARRGGWCWDMPGEEKRTSMLESNSAN